MLKRDGLSRGFLHIRLYRSPQYMAAVFHDHPVENPVFPHPSSLLGLAGHYRRGRAAGVSARKMERGGRWDILILPFFIYGQINIFTAHIFNAIFLEAYGIDGSAVITQSEETSSTLNDQSVWAYDAVMKTAEGQDVVTGFDTMSASIYPITNAILIPPQGERFVVRYIPGFPRNFVIMRDLSPYGKKYRLGEDRRPVEKAAAQFAASLDNRAFVAEYRNALTAFIDQHRDDADPALIENYRAQLGALPTPD